MVQSVQKQSTQIGKLRIAIKSKETCAPGIEPTTSANMNKTWRMRDGSTWHLTSLDQSRTVQANEKATDCNKINENFIKKAEKVNGAPGIEPTTSANMNKRLRMRGGSTWHLNSLERSKTVSANRKATD